MGTEEKEIAKRKAKDDTLIEWQFIRDYGRFGLRMNFVAAAALLRQARAAEEARERKSLCLTGQQMLHSSIEDYAILLKAVQGRSKGKHLHLGVGVEDREDRGTTRLPRVFKRYESARQSLDDLGLVKVTYVKVRKFFDLSPAEFEDNYREWSAGVKNLASYQERMNLLKNWLKHGKPVMEGDKSRPGDEYVTFLRWARDDANGGGWMLEKYHVEASLDELEGIVRQIGKIYIRSLEVLWLFLLNYSPQHHEDFRVNVFVSGMNECDEEIEKLGIKTPDWLVSGQT